MQFESMVPVRRRSVGHWAAAACLVIGSLLIIGRTRVSVPRSRMPAHAVGAADSANQPKVAVGYGKLPLSFEINRGQTDSQVKFLSRGSGYTLFLTGNEALLALRKRSAGGNLRSAFSQSRLLNLSAKRSRSSAVLPSLLLPLDKLWADRL